ncbi:Lipase, class 3 [Corchorus olitorius]|uniref:Phospholipase A1 n=1 Tax=Corchorus olitorius TaxID=93759 RepID=A0A1R3H4T6_9ROSI|nr:Lipase, class 3 [Corchorus olitorius]
MGYVAVATDEGKAVLGRRDILIAWRGTLRNLELVNDLQADLVSVEDIFGDNEDSKVLSEVRRLVDLYADEEISITLTGHSLGAAVATLSAVDIVANGYNKPTTKPDKDCLVTAFVFASPRVGDSRFKELFAGLKNLHVLRIKDDTDVVPNLPLPLPLFQYTHVGEELLIDTLKSPYLKNSLGIKKLMVSHQLEPYLHGVAGTQGPKEEFKLDINRDISLVNKYLDALKDEFRVPVEWWIEKNKGMAQQDDGSWILDDHEPNIPPTI